MVEFGDYVRIEKETNDGPNEWYTYKVINRKKSNRYVDVPVQHPTQESIHDTIVDVVSCIYCDIDETEVLQYRLVDVITKEDIQRPNYSNTQNSARDRK